MPDTPYGRYEEDEEPEQPSAVDFESDLLGFAKTLFIVIVIIAAMYFIGDLL